MTDPCRSRWLRLMCTLGACGSRWCRESRQAPQLAPHPSCSFRFGSFTNFNHCFLLLLCCSAGETIAEKRVCSGYCLTSKVTVFRGTPSAGDRAGVSRRRIDLGVDGLTSAAAMPPSRQADCSIARAPLSWIFYEEFDPCRDIYPRKQQGPRAPDETPRSAAQRIAGGKVEGLRCYARTRDVVSFCRACLMPQGDKKQQKRKNQKQIQILGISTC